MAAMHICFSLLMVLFFPIEAAHAIGFTTDLIHRDSPRSPFHNPSTTRSDRLTAAFHRSLSRHSSFCHSKDNKYNIQSQIVPTSGEYLMKLSLGTPPRETLAIADTGSDLTWTQCKPCTQCYKQNSPLFDPRNSSSYRELSCQSNTCEVLITSGCNDQNTCEYRMSYGDQSYSVGTLATETFTMGSAPSPVSVRKVVFGCGHEDQGTFNETATGIVGLGGGGLSLVSQLNASINGKFSYCLVGFDETKGNTTSKINFGDNAVVSGSGVVSTPIIKKSSASTFYYLTLESVVVGNKSLTYNTYKSKDESLESEGNIIIDSGTTLTFLPTDLYGDLESEVKQSIKADPVNDPQGVLSLCYNPDNIFNDLPNMTFKFKGADWKLPPSSTFIQNGELLCLAIIPADEIAIFGNLSQMNFLIGYDLINHQLSFMPTDCSKH